SDFQHKLDEERQRSSEEMARVKTEMDTYRSTLEQELHAKEVELGQRQQKSEEGLRTDWRKREEELLAKHQEAADRSQRSMAEIQARFYEKEGVLKTLQDKLTDLHQDRQLLIDKFKQFQTDTAQRQATLEEQVRTRDQELRTLNADYTARDEARGAQ